MQAENSPKQGLQLGLGLVLLTGVVFALGLATEVPYSNGPEYSRWIWRGQPFERALMLLGAPLVLYAYLLREWGAQEKLSRRDAAWLIGGLVVCLFAFQFASLLIDKRGIHLLTKIVKHPGATSYYTDAAEIQSLRSWLEAFPRAELHYHSETHPPGPILYYYAFIQLLGDERAPLVSGSLIGLLAALGVISVYRLAKLWTDDRKLRLGACFSYALLPGMIHFFPEFDQLYPSIAIAMICCWAVALERVFAAVWLGLALFVASMMAYNLVVVGAFMAPYALLYLRRARWQRAAWLRCATAVLIALATFSAAHLLTWVTTGYPPIESFRASLESQVHFAAHLKRPWASVIFTDPYDFFLSSGWMSLPMLLLSLRRPAAMSGEPSVDRAITLLAIFTIAVVDLSGLLRCEAARVWLFLQPLVVVPMGIQLARWRPGDRYLWFALQALIVLIIRCKLHLVL